jgi:hypothetical protein
MKVRKRDSSDSGFGSWETAFKGFLEYQPKRGYGSGCVKVIQHSTIVNKTSPVISHKYDVNNSLNQAALPVNLEWAAAVTLLGIYSICLTG